MAGAIMSHLTILGIEVLGDGGYLFFLALMVFFGSAFLLLRHLCCLVRVTKFCQNLVCLVFHALSTTQLQHISMDVASQRIQWERH
jgi:hypothetical protein